MPRRTSTWIYLLLVIATVVAETTYAVNDNSDLQGHALAYLIVATAVFAIYRGVTRGRRGATRPDGT